MTAFRRNYLEERRAEPVVIFDLGSQDFNGSYRPVFALPPWRNVCVALAAGNNVDVVLGDPCDNESNKWHDSVLIARKPERRG